MKKLLFLFSLLLAFIFASAGNVSNSVAGDLIKPPPLNIVVIDTVSADIAVLDMVNSKVAVIPQINKFLVNNKEYIYNYYSRFTEKNTDNTIPINYVLLWFNKIRHLS